MNKDEIIMILGTIKVAYPRFYSNISKEDIHNTIDLWLEMFKDDDKQDITRAVKELICELEFPPTIADIKKKIEKYKNDRKFIEYARNLENSNKTLTNIKVELIESPKKDVDVTKHINNIKRIIFGGDEQ